MIQMVTLTNQGLNERSCSWISPTTTTSPIIYAPIYDNYDIIYNSFSRFTLIYWIFLKCQIASSIPQRSEKQSPEPFCSQNFRIRSKDGPPGVTPFAVRQAK